MKNIPSLQTLKAHGASCGLIYRVSGLHNAICGLLEFSRELYPVTRVNALYAALDLSTFITMADTSSDFSMETFVRRPGEKPPFVMPEVLDRPVLVDDLNPFKADALHRDNRRAHLPFMQHSSLLRIPLFTNGEHVFILNFWADTPAAFNDKALPALLALTDPLGEVLHSMLSTMDLALPAPAQQTFSSRGRMELCPGLAPVRELVREVSPTDCTVLLLGETGVGKGEVASAIHELSTRADKPFVSVNCGAIPETLLESELFGYERGAFTGAHTSRRGYFEQADGGTLFLDEIGEMSLSAQVRLLRVLDSGHITRVGNPLPLALNVRVVAATHSNLAAKVRSGDFRQDLWYRLSVFPVEIPPLRRRKEDISPLIHYFIRQKAQKMGITPPAEATRAELTRLYAHDWPGNVRELENVVERSLIRARSRVEQKSLHFWLDVDTHYTDTRPVTDCVRAVGAVAEDWPSLAELEERYIRAVLEETRGKLSGPGSASEILGIHYTTLRTKLRKG